MRAVVAGALLAIAACGRFGFGSLPPPSDGDPPPPDTGARDAAAGSSCAFELCDGFEGSALAAVWTPTATGVSIDDTIAHSGTQSLHLHTDAIAVNGGAGAYIAESATFASPNPSFYVRAFLRIAATPVDNVGMLVANQTTAMPSCDGLFLTSTGFTVFSQFSEKSMDTGFAPATDTWFCAVWNVVRATGPTGMESITGDIPTTTLSNVMTDASPALGQLDLGALFANSTDTSPQPAFDMWVDDVIVSDGPVTCSAEN